jgi:hypothetical protein
MKRDMELVRLILLKVEEEGTTPDYWMPDFMIDGYEEAPDEVAYHVWLLRQAGFLEAEQAASDEFLMEPKCLTWSGAEFLDSIRDPEVWRKTKEGAARAGGAGVELLWEIAKAYTKAKARETLGLDLVRRDCPTALRHQNP